MRRLLPLLALLAAALLTAPAAHAASTQEATFQDDNELIYNHKGAVNARLDELKLLGVDRLRLTILWSAIAPNPNSRTRPSFDAADPDQYPAGAWENYDHVLRGAVERGLKVNFNVTGPSPLWANQVAPRDDIRKTYEPSPFEFAQFVAAVGRRYDGSRAGLPRVDYWSVWNEPNHSGWLTPTWQESGGKQFERSAVVYRNLLDAAYAALRVTGHANDTVLFGETAPSGTNRKSLKSFMKPVRFVRALYCVNGRNKRLTGKKAQLLECGASASEFAKTHPALFRATGYAHHPYQLLTAPSVKPRDKQIITMAVLGRLTRKLDKIQRQYGSRRKLPLYLTEFGYQTKPDRLGVDFLAQSAFLNQSEFMAHKRKRVRTMAQFLLVDDGEPIGLTFQSGLASRDGRLKPAYAAYRLPVWVRGKKTKRKLWAVLRPAAAGRRAEGVVQRRRKGSRTYKTVKTVTSRGRRNVVKTRVRARSGDSLRVVYGPWVSRTVTLP